MPSVTIHPRPCLDQERNAPNPLPSLLQTPSGLAILEIQGTIQTPSPAGADTGKHPDVGKLVFPNYSSSDQSAAWMKRVYLYVGKHQRLMGEVKRLARPLAVLRKRVISEFDEASGEELEIAEIVYYKIIFSNRPEPVGEE